MATSAHEQERPRSEAPGRNRALAVEAGVQHSFGVTWPLEVLKGIQSQSEG